jgi:hypothetical protein
MLMVLQEALIFSTHGPAVGSQPVVLQKWLPDRRNILKVNHLKAALKSVFLFLFVDLVYLCTPE